MGEIFAYAQGGRKQAAPDRLSQEQSVALQANAFRTPRVTQADIAMSTAAAAAAVVIVISASPRLPLVDPADGGVAAAGAVVPLPLAVELAAVVEEAVVEGDPVVEGVPVVVGGSATTGVWTAIVCPAVTTELMFGTALTALLTLLAKLPAAAVSRVDLTLATFVPAGAYTTAFTTTDPAESVTVT